MLKYSPPTPSLQTGSGQTTMPASGTGGIGCRALHVADVFSSSLNTALRSWYFRYLPFMCWGNSSGRVSNLSRVAQHVSSKAGI